MKSKVRGMKRTLDALAERYAELALSKTETIGIAHADNEEGKAYLVQRLRDKGLTGKCLSVCYEPVTGSPCRPGDSGAVLLRDGQNGIIRLSKNYVLKSDNRAAGELEGQGPPQIG